MFKTYQFDCEARVRIQVRTENAADAEEQASDELARLFAHQNIKIDVESLGTPELIQEPVFDE